ncbi:ATP-binding protein [[Phormidium] sp. ETS-05]|uniref:hybrid sensor histidine kinase/response regulator n=1 Tax=[Phormidium] sp. ETS-05 TaxID=222819 RepID=UPI0018EEF0A3|nr:ATP-binding protein [[Phormidium] sp. ETS-05]
MPTKILFVDDEESFPSLIRRHFRKQIRAGEMDCVFAANGLDALQTIQSNPDVDIVFTDINMPQMDGLTLLEKVHAFKPQMKMVVVSAYNDMKNIRTAMNRGAFDFLTKPIDFQDLEITIQRAIKEVAELKESENRFQAAQTQMIQSEKMSALGELIAGVAHEINNPVGFITANLETTEEYLTGLAEVVQLYQQHFPDVDGKIADKIKEVDVDYIIDDIPELVSSMKEGTQRIVNLSTSLRTFSRSDVSHKVEFNIHDGIDSTVTILKHRLKANLQRPEIKIVKQYGELPPVVCFPGQLNQVFMNLIANSIDALDEYNEGLDFEAAEAHPNIIAIATEVNGDGETVSIKIKDTGKGIPQEAINKIFEHLFTTKPPGKGTGLGLYISRQIVEERHGGKLSCNSTPGEGTEFIIEIPIKSPVD